MVSQKEYDDLDKKYTFAIVLIGIFFVVLLVTLINLYSKIIENQELKEHIEGYREMFNANSNCFYYNNGKGICIDENGKVNWNGCEVKT